MVENGINMNDRKLHIDGLGAGYGKKIILDGVDVEISASEIISIIGPNGAGKSTLLKTLNGLLKPIHGRIVYMDKNLNDMSAMDRAKKMSVLLTHIVDGELLSVRDVVSMGRYPYTGKMGMLKEEDHKVIDRCMKLTHTDELSKQEFDKLSDGQKQRVMLARAICQEPEILVLDEPTSFLDIRYKLEFLSVIRNLADEMGIMIIMTMHELDLAEKISDRIISIKNGHIDKVGTPKEILQGGYLEELFDIPKEYQKWLR